MALTGGCCCLVEGEVVFFGLVSVRPGWSLQFDWGHSGGRAVRPVLLLLLLLLFVGVLVVGSDVVVVGAVHGVL